MKSCTTCFKVALDDNLFCPQCGQEYSTASGELVPLVDRKDATTKRQIKTIEDFIKVSYPPFDYQSSLANISYTPFNTTTHSSMPVMPLKIPGNDPKQMQAAMNEWKEKLQQEANYIPNPVLPESTKIEYVRSDGTPIPFNSEQVSKGIKEFLKESFKWFFGPLIVVILFYWLSS